MAARATRVAAGATGGATGGPAEGRMSRVLRTHSGGGQEMLRVHALVVQGMHVAHVRGQGDETLSNVPSPSTKRKEAGAVGGGRE